MKIFTGPMGAQKNVPIKQKVKLLTSTCLFVKRKFNETKKVFSINYSYNSKCTKMIFSFKDCFHYIFAHLFSSLDKRLY